MITYLPEDDLIDFMIYEFINITFALIYQIITNSENIFDKLKIKS